MGFSQTTLDGAENRLAAVRAELAQQDESVRAETRLYDVSFVLLGEHRTQVVIPALSVFAAAARAMALLVQTNHATTEDFLHRKSRVVGGVEH